MTKACRARVAEASGMEGVAMEKMAETMAAVEASEAAGERVEVG